MIDVFAETVLLLSKAAGRLPEPVALSTIRRWHSRGCQGIKLETVKIGRRTYTSIQALHRFIGELSTVERADPESPKEQAEITDALKKAGM